MATKTRTQKTTMGSITGVGALDKAVEIDSRICFAIAYFATEADATAADAEVRAKGNTYNGGFFHGMACGRETTWDYTDPATGAKRFAVTF